MRAVEDREATIGIFVHSHGGAHEMRAQRRGWDLQGEGAPFDRVVVADPALFLEAQEAGAAPARSSTKALPASAGAIAKAALCSGR
jgi:hypothetical protein